MLCSLLQILHKKFMLSDNIRTSPESMCNATLAKLVLSWRNDSNFILTFTFNTVCCLCVLTCIALNSVGL